MNPPASATPVIVRGLEKRFGDLRAVAGISFSVRAGEIFALLGPNGAGKTTAIEILEGFGPRDGGSVSVLGVDPGLRKVQRYLRSKIGVVLQELAVEPFFTVRQVLARNAGFYEAPRPVDEVIDMVGLSEKRDAKVKSLSGGQQRKLDVGLGIIGNPEILFLDEPTTGLDPGARRGTWEIIRQFADRGTTVILTSHYMDEVEALADQVLVISHGEVVASGTPRSVGDRHLSSARISFQLPVGVAREEIPVPVSAFHGEEFWIETTEELAILHRLVGWALEKGIELPGLSVSRVTLEDVYLKLIRDDASTDANPPLGKSKWRR